MIDDQNYWTCASTGTTYLNSGTYWGYQYPPQTIPYQPDPGQKQREEDLKRELEALQKYCETIFEKEKNKEVNIMYLYRVYLIYAADRKSPQIITTGSTVAKDDEDAKVKSGVYQKIDPEWDADYVTVVCEKVAEVKVKPKPQETVIVSQSKPV